MGNELEFPIRANIRVLHSTLVEAATSLEKSGLRFQVNEINLARARFGPVVGLSIRVTKKTGEEEIGKIVVQDLQSQWYLLVVPENRTGGHPSRLDSDGRLFWEVFRSLWRRLNDLRIITLNERNELISRLKGHQWNEYNQRSKDV